MATLAQIRAQHPEYADLNDQQLADGLYKKFYSDVPRADFDAKLGVAPSNDGPPPGVTPGSREYVNWAVKQAMAGKKLPQVSPAPPRWTPPGGGTSPLDQIQAGYTSAVDAIPIAGPLLKSGLQNTKAALYGANPADIAQEDASREAANPGASTAGAITGTVLPFMAGGEVPLIAKGLGMDTSMPLLLRSLFSGGSQAGITYADNLMRGSDQTQAAQGADLAGKIGAVIPVAGSAIAAVGRAAPGALNWLTGGAVDLARNMRDPKQAAERLVGKGMGADAANGSAMDVATEQAAQVAGSPLVNLDRGGNVTRNLARTAANLSPDAKAALEGATDRGPASLRATDFLTKIVGGSADDLALREGLRKTARIVNDPAYNAANASPAAQNIYTPGIQQLMQAPEMQAAVKEAENIGKTRAATGRGPAPKAPFKYDANGNLILTPSSPPSLQFWDNVQQALRRQIESLGPKERARLGDLTELRNNLLGELDTTVPEFQTARQGAAKFFGAEDAMDAGRNFASTPRQLPEAKAAFSKFSDPEKKAFAIGWASTLVDSLKSRDSYSIIKQTFENPNAREMAQMALGPMKAAQLEAYLKVEKIMQFSSDALRGGPSTARQLAMMGAVGGGTGLYGAATGDWKPLSLATVVTAGRAGMRFLGKNVDQKVMDEVAKLLSSGNKADLQRVTTNAAMSPKWKAALDSVFTGIGEGARGLTTASGRPAPVQITVNGGAQ